MINYEQVQSNVVYSPGNYYPVALLGENSEDAGIIFIKVINGSNISNAIVQATPLSLTVVYNDSYDMFASFQIHKYNGSNIVSIGFKQTVDNAVIQAHYIQSLFYDITKMPAILGSDTLQLQTVATISAVNGISTSGYIDTHSVTMRDISVDNIDVDGSITIKGQELVTADNAVTQDYVDQKINEEKTRAQSMEANIITSINNLDLELNNVITTEMFNEATSNFVTQDQVDLTVELDHKVVDTLYQTQVLTPFDRETGLALTTETELVAHADHDAAMYQQMTDNVKTSIEASLTNYYNKQETINEIASEIDHELMLYTLNVMQPAISSAVAEGLSQEQIDSIVAQAVAQAGANVVTQEQLNQTVTALLSAINSSGAIAAEADSGIDPNGQYFLKAVRYTNGLQIITGWVAKCGSRFSAYFPTGFEFIDTNYSASGNIADDEAGLDNGQVRTCTFGSLRTNSFTCICAKYEISVLVGAAVSDDCKYSVSFIGRWK